MNNENINDFQKENNIEVIKGLIKATGGYVTSKMITKLGIHRMYLNIMVKDKLIEKVNKGVYISKDAIEDIYYTFQLRYSKIIYSRFTALYFHGLTEVYPSNFDITVDYNYHVDAVNNNNSVIKCKKDILNLGVTEINTPFGHKVKAYDKERCICDIIKYRNKFDIEQVKKSVKMYIKSEDKNICNLSKYSTKMGINKEVMEFVGMFYE